MHATHNPATRGTPARLPALRQLLKGPQPADTVAVTLTGTVPAVVGLARHLSTVTNVLSMEHKAVDRPATQAVAEQLIIAIQLTIHHVGRSA
jgi:hypothetical protein